MKETTDLWFAAFLLLKGETVANFIKLGPRKAKFQFSVEDEKWKAYKLEFFSSDIQQIKQKQEQLKDLLY
jgi:hypothetical protein